MRDRAGGAQRADRRRAGRRQVGRAVACCRDRGARPGRADLAAGRQAGRAGGVGAGRRAARRTGRRRGDRAAAAACARRWTRATASCSPAAGARSRRDDGLPLHLVVCDELAFYLTLPDKRQRQEFAELLRDLVARGRAAGVIVCAATQKPGADVVPDGAARPVRVPAGAALQHAAGVRHDPRPGLGVGRRGRVDDPGRAARRRLSCSPRASGRCASRASTSPTTTCRRSPSAPPPVAPTPGSPTTGDGSAEAVRHDRRRRAPRRAAESALVRDVLERAADPEQWERFERQLRATGYCRRPIRLRGQRRRDRHGHRRGPHRLLDRAASPTRRC